MEQIDILLWTEAEVLEKHPYFLTNRMGKQVLSQKPGKLGGHKGLKIYGELDCPSAARYLKKGQYVQHRVFFENEETAIAAGFRPCGICMPDKYKKWKEFNKKQKE